MEIDYKKLTIAIILFIGLIIFINRNNSLEEKFRASIFGPVMPLPPVGWRWNWINPFQGDYGYIAEHQFLKDLYSSPYYEAPNPCMVPATVNYQCVQKELLKGTSYRDAFIGCSIPPSINARC
jgi:hypothetical protein